MTKKTVKKHLEDADLVKKTIDDANALLIKSQRILSEARSVFEDLIPYQHPQLRMRTPHHMRDAGDKPTPKRVIEEQINRINLLLGDRA